VSGHSIASAVLLILAATVYAFGKTFFWPTTLGVVSEQYPKGGALLLNAISGVGMARNRYLAAGETIVSGADIIGELHNTCVAGAGPLAA